MEAQYHITFVNKKRKEKQNRFLSILKKKKYNNSKLKVGLGGFKGRG